MKEMALIILVAVGGCKTTMVAEKPEQSPCGCSIKTVCNCKDGKEPCGDNSCKAS